MGSKTSKQWAQHIRGLAVDSSRVAFTRHALARMRERHITQVMVLTTLRLGAISRVPEPNLMKGTVECRKEYFIAGRQIAVVAAVSDDNPSLIVVTAMELT